MSSTTANGISHTKTNLSVASLINGNPVSVKAPSAPEKLLKTEVLTTTKTNGPKNVPTVASVDLLYKSVSPKICSTSIPPSSIASASSMSNAINYTIQQYPNIEAIKYRADTSSNPLTNIKTLTNAVTNPLNRIEVNQFSSKPYVPILPASHIKSTNPSPLKNNVLGKNVVKFPSNVMTSYVVYSNPSLSTTAIPIHAPTTKMKTVIPKPSTSSKQSEVKAVFVPRGWNRILEKESITYVRYVKVNALSVFRKYFLY